MAVTFRVSAARRDLARGGAVGVCPDGARGASEEVRGRSGAQVR